MSARTKRRMQLVWRCLAELRRCPSDPVSGQFKLVQRVSVKAARGSKLHHYVIKRGASPEEVEMHHHDGGSFDRRHRDLKGDGQMDLLREVESQEVGHVSRRGIVAYVAWGWVNGVFYAVQPAVCLSQPCEMYGVDEDGDPDCDCPLYDVSYVRCIGDTDPYEWHNCGLYKGKIKAYDWGYDMPVTLTTAEFRAASTRYAKAA